jgi:hypothetical protein
MRLVFNDPSAVETTWRRTVGWIGSELEGSDRGLSEVPSRHLPGPNEEERQSVYAVFRPSFETKTFRKCIQSCTSVP